ncbi:lyase [Paenibacillus baekrokdamisoli]|uniref:Lyase n=1 Tax=Paenibacillus baekrokdamisoli TaxID=1712516 RepID=A0A3G9IU98_9BACL|nr:polysaccharide lyase 8 family protein [Paenibacillus baekrokdamisoli]MBB3071658.1 hyaluronate lyase [Paenibacillus baekrokdamisoli]BBH21832.1 lyase [Paenibacillus baekrokdamisoli]
MFISNKKKVIVVILMSFLGGFLWPQSSEHADGADNYAQIRQRWVVRLVGEGQTNVIDPDLKQWNQGVASEVSNTRYTGYLDRMNKGANLASLWPDLTKWSSDPLYSGDIYQAYSRLRSMALAYAAKGTALYHQQNLKNSIVSGLDWMYANRYNERVVPTPRSNWWDWQIGIPLLLNDIVVLMYDQLNSNQVAQYMRAVDKFCPDPTIQYDFKQEETGANRVDKAMIVIIKGILQKNALEIVRGRDALSKVFEYVEVGDGFYRDGSFIQHSNIAYTGGYGYVLLDHLADVLYLLNGSEWSINDLNVSNVYQWVFNSFAPLMYKGIIMDMVRGRNIARSSWQDNNIGREINMAILRLSEFAPAGVNTMLKQIVKGAVQEDRQYSNYYTGLDAFHIKRIKQLLNDKLIIPVAKKNQSIVFAAMDRAVHQRKDFAFAISMTSERIANYERINNENLRGWYTGAGMTYLYNSDMHQYNEEFWPTVDPYRLPGTTTDGTTRNAGALSSASWVGGTVLGEYSVVGMDVASKDSSLLGKKSWFMFDDEIVALGAGISEGSGRKVETIIDNRKLIANGSNLLKVDGLLQSSSLNWDKTFQNVHWAHFQGNGTVSNIGYFFPDEANVQGKREARSGSWNQLNSGDSSRVIKASYLSLSFDHGSSPQDVKYAYVLLPNKTAIETSLYSKNPNIVILENSTNVQAVREQTLNMTAVNFWTSGTYGTINVDAPASMMLQESGKNLLLSIADPTQKQEKINVELNKSASQIISVDNSVTVLETYPTIRLLIDTHDSHGRKFFVKFRQ